MKFESLKRFSAYANSREISKCGRKSRDYKEGESLGKLINLLRKTISAREKNPQKLDKITWKQETSSTFKNWGKKYYQKLLGMKRKTKR